MRHRSRLHIIEYSIVFTNVLPLALNISKKCMYLDQIHTCILSNT